MRDAVLLVSTVIVGLGLGLILWRELHDSAERRKVGLVRDSIEVLLPVVGTLALVVWVWSA